jgi:outer membrane autotransporter protein
MQLLNSATLGNVNINVTGASLSLANNSSLGTATIAVQAGGISFADFSSAGNSYITNSDSSTTFSDQSSAANATLLANSGRIAFEGSSTGGQARLIVNSSAMLDLSAHSGSLSVGSIEGSGSFQLGANRLTVGSNNMSTEVSGAISGAGGSLEKVGTGGLTLSGANTYTGGTSVDAGSLVLTGSLASGVTIGGNGTLGGSGSVTGNVGNSGIVAPGGFNTLTVNGNYTQTSGGTYQVAVNSVGQGDRLSVSGTAALAGTVAVNAASGNYGRSTAYTILTAAGGITGNFSSVSSNLAFLTPSLSYDRRNVYLTLLQAGNAFASGAQTGNQRSVGTVLDQASPAATGDFATVLNAISLLDSTQGPRALDAIGGQNYSGFSTTSVLTAQAFMTNFSQQAGSASGGANRIALTEGSGDGACGIDACDVAPETRWGAWGGGIAGAGTVAGDGSSHGTTYSLGGFAAGLDRRIDPHVLAGITVGYAGSTLYTQGMDGRGTSDTVQIGLYGEYSNGPFFLDALTGYARSHNQMQRPIVIAGLQPRTAHGDTWANQFFGQLEAGYRLGVYAPAHASLLPFVRLQGSTSTQDAFSEWGADSLNLNLAQQTTNSLRTVAGSELDGTIRKVDLKLRLGWSHEYADTSRPATASFAGAPALSFTTQGAAAPRDGAIVGLGLNATIADATSIYARYEGEVQGGNTSHIFAAGLRWVW